MVPKKPLGDYRLGAVSDHGESAHCVELYQVAVETALERWKEKHQRKRRWFGLKDAAQAVGEPKLQYTVLSLKANRRFAKPLH